MKTCDELANRWNNCQGGQILVDHTHPLKMYLNVNEENRKELLIPVLNPIYSFYHSRHALATALLFTFVSIPCGPIP